MCVCVLYQIYCLTSIAKNGISTVTIHSSWIRTRGKSCSCRSTACMHINICPSHVFVPEICVISELEDLSASVDVQDVYTKIKCKVGSFNIDHYRYRQSTILHVVLMMWHQQRQTPLLTGRRGFWTGSVVIYKPEEFSQSFSLCLWCLNRFAETLTRSGSKSSRPFPLHHNDSSPCLGPVKLG